jgi:ketol-acid reductoisomerase
MDGNLKTASLIRYLKNRQTAIIGYGSQGHAQALNLRDSGIVPIIGLRANSKSKRAAISDGFKVLSPQKAISQSDIISILIPDYKHKEFFKNFTSPDLLHGRALIFAHGMTVAFGLVSPPSGCDVILVAPHGPGVRIRELYQQGKTFTSFWAIKHDYSGDSTKIAKAYAAAIGSPPSCLFKSSFRDEAVGDIFGEQAVLCGGLVGLMQSGFDTLVSKGFSPETAYLECIYQLDLIVDLVKKYGPAGMLEKISVTAAFGSLQSRKVLFDKQMNNKMKKLYREIENGEFVKSLMKDETRGMRHFTKDLRLFKKSFLQKTHESLSRRLKS